MKTKQIVEVIEKTSELTTELINLLNSEAVDKKEVTSAIANLEKQIKKYPYDFVSNKWSEVKSPLEKEEWNSTLNAAKHFKENLEIEKNRLIELKKNKDRRLEEAFCGDHDNTKLSRTLCHKCRAMRKYIKG